MKNKVVKTKSFISDLPFKGESLQAVYSNVLKSAGKSKLYSRILALILLPFVLYGSYYIYTNINSRGVDTYAVDPLIITYADGPPPNPMFSVSDMLPGDFVEKVFNVKNDSAEGEGVFMDAVKKEELKAFAGILDALITNETDAITIFNGKLQSFFDLPPISLGIFAAGAEKSFRVKVTFPSSSGNEYQEAKLVFDILWNTEAPPIELPEECKLLEGKITSVIEGTEGNDRIWGTIANELILAKGGSDRVDGKSGDDCVIGADGDDRFLDGGSGEDIIVGGSGNDRIDGGEGKDIIYGNAGNDNIDGGEDDDIIYAGDGDDEVDGGNKDDKIWGGIGNDEIDGGSGNDLIYGEEGDDEIDGGSQNDEIHGGIGLDELEGGSGNDHIFGDADNDQIKGNSGNDILDGGTETDSLNGNSGTDTCVNGETLSSCEL
ncbi:hypothetical protein A2955_01810 [Candidatus Woesebacteria bacterium RIFCSPLOWO2_01_FULL_37_19]|uniref:Uncharacterized protein n=1 Tax=Candidatus Woesebacteria bacterium RIFCSPLOWO2_01_FULL_37_19 TaxID=1802514 RepID=A0A1F8AYE0_9BACT|nr:MAG: hypothetical protein A2955_01810 [Candidatus Woesebacteria bacterium RIFCSPLOWO2_01_FULL_37_19]